MSAKIQLLSFASCWRSMLQFYNLYLHLQFNIQVSNFSTPVVDLTLFHDSTLQFGVFNIQVYAIQHPSFRNSTSKFTQFNIQVFAIQHSTLENACFRYPSAIQSMTVSVGSGNYQNSPLVGADKGRSLYPRQQPLPRKMARYFIPLIPNTLSYVSNVFCKFRYTQFYIQMSYKVKYHICHQKYKKRLMDVSLFSIQRCGNNLGRVRSGQPKYCFKYITLCQPCSSL